MNNKKERYLRLEEELKSNEGFIYLKRREVHGRSLKVFGGNFRDLISLIDAVQDHDFYLRQKSAGTMGLLQSDLIRLFHNYLAAAKSLVDHTRAYVDQWHKDEGFRNSYAEKVKFYFSDDEVSKVTLDLRNYLLHRGFPPSTIRETFFIGTGLPPEVQIIFKTLHLEDWKGWSSKSKKFLNSRSGFFELRPLVVMYQDKVSEFYTWFDMELNSIHRDELSGFQRLQDEILAVDKE